MSDPKEKPTYEELKVQCIKLENEISRLRSGLKFAHALLKSDADKSDVLEQIVRTLTRTTGFL